MTDKRFVGSSLGELLRARQDSHKPLKVGMIGAGKFGSMFLAQARSIPGLRVVAIADVSVKKAKDALALAGWPADSAHPRRIEDAVDGEFPYLSSAGDELAQSGLLDVIVEGTGDPVIGISNAFKAINAGTNVVMVNVEGDALGGPLLARKAAARGVVYSLAYGDQPALIYELVEWAKLSGFQVICAGKGTKYIPEYHFSTPDTVWDVFDFKSERIQRGEYNPKMYNSFIDGTKSAIEMAAVANACNMPPQAHGLAFPAAGIDDLANICRPEKLGGCLSHEGTVEVVSSLQRDGTPVAGNPHHIVFVSFKAQNKYAKRCFKEYGLKTDESGSYAAMYRPYHLVGLELSISVLKAGLRGEATGSPRDFVADVGARAKKDLLPGEELDGEGGYCVYGSLCPARMSLKDNILPVGLANKIRLKNKVPKGEFLHWDDVNIDKESFAVRFRREMEMAFQPHLDKHR